MLRQIIFAVGLLMVASLVLAGEAGRIVFVAGDAQSAGQRIVTGHSVREGDEITTGADGYAYLKTIDDGFLILRPNTRARVTTYHIDLQTPSNTRVKLELLSGVARNISGQAVKQARQNFRFNTPVAAIGVRGTDFVVFADQDTARVMVISGGVVVSGFSGGCKPEGGGPCEGSTSRELFADQVGKLLQVRGNQSVPQLMRGNGHSPDVIAPPRPDEPAGKGAGSGAVGGQSGIVGDLSLDAKKNASLSQNLAAVGAVGAQIAEPARTIIWGRWQAVLDQAASVDVVKLTDGGAKLLAINAQFALLRARDGEWQVPTSGTMGFALKQSEAYILDEAHRTLTSAKLENGRLQVDFAKTSFDTSFDLVNQSERFKLQAQGSVSRDGLLNGASQFEHPTNMAVNGVLSKENGGSAAYLFQGRIDGQRVASGATYWTK